MSTIPTLQEVRKLYDEFSLPVGLRQHTILVGKVAHVLSHRLHAQGVSVNVDLTTKAALLHDIMKIECAKNNEPGEAHALRGSELMKERGYEELASPIGKHFQPMILDSQNKSMTWEEKIVYISDKLAGMQITTVEQRIENQIRKNPDYEDAILRCKENIIALEQEVLKKAGLTHDQLKEEVENIHWQELEEQKEVNTGDHTK